MNILRLCYEYPPLWGGLTAGPFEMTHAQSLHGHHIRYLAGGWPKRPVEHLENVRVRRLPSALPKVSLFTSTAPAALPFALRWQRWADVVHGHQHLPIYYHLWRKRFGGNTPYVLHLHVTAAGRAARTPTQQLDGWTRRFEWPLHRWSDRVGCAVADAIICVSESVRGEAIQHYGATAAKLHVVSNGVNTSRFSPNGDNRRTALGFTADDVVILFVGVLSERKRPLLLLETLAHLPNNWKILFIGQGQLAPQLAAQVAQRGWEDRVRLSGFVPYPDLPALYRTADLFALPARYEGFPKVVLEALASGLPVVTTPSFVIDEVLKPYVSVTASEPTSAEFAAALQAWHGRPVDVSVLQAHYSWQHKAAQIEKIYRGIIRG